MLAVIETGGKQYCVEPGDKIKVEKLDVDSEDDFVFDKVLLDADDKETKIGAPYLSGAKVTARVMRNGRADKIRIFKYKAKKRYRKTQGHRQPFTEVEIGKIS